MLSVVMTRDTAVSSDVTQRDIEGSVGGASYSNMSTPLSGHNNGGRSTIPKLGHGLGIAGISSNLWASWPLNYGAAVAK